MKHVQRIKSESKLQLTTKTFLLLFLLVGFITSQAQTLLRVSKEELLDIYGTPDKAFTDTAGYEVMQYEVQEKHSETMNTLPEQIVFYLKNDVCKKKEHIMLARFYTIQATYFDRSYTCADDQRSTAWITNFNTFYRMKVNGAVAIYTEETFE